MADLPDRRERRAQVSRDERDHRDEAEGEGDAPNAPRNPAEHGHAARLAPTRCPADSRFTRSASICSFAGAGLSRRAPASAVAATAAPAAASKKKWLPVET